MAGSGLQWPTLQGMLAERREAANMQFVSPKAKHSDDIYLSDVELRNRRGPPSAAPDTPEYLATEVMSPNMYLSTEAFSEKYGRPVLGSLANDANIAYGARGGHRRAKKKMPKQVSDMYLNVSGGDYVTIAGESNSRAELIHPADQSNSSESKQKERSGTPSNWIFGRYRKGQKSSKQDEPATFIMGSSFGCVSPDMYDDDSMPLYAAIDSPPPPYFHGKIDELTANDRIWQAGMEDGVFLVREVKLNNEYVLSVARDDKVEHIPISRNVRTDGLPGHHFIVNGNVRLWQTCCIDEVIAEILTSPDLRTHITGSPAPLVRIAAGVDGRLQYLQGIVEHRSGLLDPRVHLTPNGKVAQIGSRVIHHQNAMANLARKGGKREAWAEKPKLPQLE
eukprot:m.193241 g.193241  ORF g.193241 m.193241 type:complete len:392 (+) comp18627_c0_seq2:124-1299(+)